MREDAVETGTVICPKCGERNADNFRFCGMCGAVLEAGRQQRSTSKPDAPRSGDVPVSLRITANPARAGAGSQRPTSSASSSSASTDISGPSLLGLGSLPQSGPTIDALRDKAFSGTSPTFLYEDARPRRGRTLLLVIILAVLAAGVWMRYRYLGFGGIGRPQTAAAPQTAGDVPSDQTQSKTTNDASSTAPSQTAAPPQTAPSPPANAPGAKTDDTTSSADTAAKESTTPSQTPAQTEAQKPATTVKQVAKIDVPSKSLKPVAVTKAAANDIGSSTFLKGEAYLYGRGVAENCDEAIKNLRAASASGNAKARSTFGTMYATGHCVPRDLPTSYSWFSKALQADPNNQVLEKDLTAIWNQMTPPERQLATKLRQ